MRKDRSCSAGLLEFPPTNSSPDATRRNKDKYHGQSSSGKLRSTPHGSLVDLTIFHIPGMIIDSLNFILNIDQLDIFVLGMDVKLHYQSKVVSVDTPDQGQPTPDFDKAFSSSGYKSSESDQSRIDRAFERQDSQELKLSSSLQGITNPNYGCSPTSSRTSLDDLQFGGSVSPQDTFKATSAPVYKKFGVKKASLFAWMTLQSVPEETIISPHILEFLEQTLEPIPKIIPTTDSSFPHSDQDLTNYGNYVYASFPVDVIVYFHMQPSTFRFSCLPVSRVECLLQLPSLDIVFSSKRAEDELFYR